MGKIVYEHVNNQDDLVKLLNSWRSNGWDLVRQFVQIIKVGTGPCYTVFYDSDLDREKFI